MDQQTPGLPGLLSALAKVSPYEYGDSRADRPEGNWPLDPEPLARALAAVLGIGGDLVFWRQALAEDDRDGPIHLVHLLTTCEYAARKTGGSLPTRGAADHPTDDRPVQVLIATVSGPGLADLADALREGGRASATAVARAMGPAERDAILDMLLHLWAAPIVGLTMDPTDEHVCRRS